MATFPLQALGNIMTFLSTPDMNIVGLHLAAAFVFNKSLDPKEEVVHTSNYQVTRSMLRSLEPGQMVREEVLILLANMLSKDSGEEHWFLLATITIYFPLWTEGHWMLLVIDLNREELICLDSDRKTGPRYARRRRRAIKNVVSCPDYPRDSSDDWFDDPEAARPEMSDFKPKLPAVPQQDFGSNDSEMFMAQWMIMYHLWGTYNVEKIIPYSRMRLAIDLVLRVQNDLADEVSEGVVSYWRKFAGDLPPSP
ncbi:hypothetical protein PIB30_028971 [Stylosanthes scabra]|uniref:Ubiquitin-like protease family profile domain-containing protein n=1 Tax=Stylosanthes scabra TaxID=79078 RepID=A0ABU6VE71_9FABA|nr:hypothetical protein [Stylosanthes scabra]